MNFYDYYQLNEILDMTKRCDGFKIISDEIVDNKSVVVVDAGRDIIVNIIMSVLPVTGILIAEFNFNKRNTSAYSTSIDGDEIGNIGRVFDSMYCVLKGKNFDPNEIKYTITGGDKDVLVPIKYKWYTDAYNMLMAYKFSDPEILRKIKSNIPLKMEEYKIITSYLNANYAEDADKIVYNPIINISRNFNVKNLRSEYYNKIINKNFPNIRTQHNRTGFEHTIKLHGSFING